MTTMKKKRERHRSLTRAALRPSRVINQFATDKYEQIVKGDLHGTTSSHATSLQQAYDTNCFVEIKPTTRLRLSCT